MTFLLNRWFFKFYEVDRALTLQPALNEYFDREDVPISSGRNIFQPTSNDWDRLMVIFKICFSFHQTIFDSVDIFKNTRSST